MRLKHAFPRAKQGDPRARAVVVATYSYVAAPTEVEEALDEYTGELGGLADHIRWLQEHPPSSPPTAVAVIHEDEWSRGAGLQIAEGAGRTPALNPKVERPGSEPEQPDSAPEQPGSEPEQPDSAPVTPRAIPLTRYPPPRRKPPSEPATSAMPVKAFRGVVNVAMALTPNFPWQAHDSLHIQVGDGEVVVFGRRDALAAWISLKAETSGRATAAIPRRGAGLLRRVAGRGPVHLALHDDRIVLHRDRDPIVVPARVGAVPAIPAIEIAGGLVFERAALAAALDEGDDIALTWDGHRLQVGDTPVEVTYGCSRSWSVNLDPRLLLSSIVRGAEQMATLEVPTKPDSPVVVTCGPTTCLIAQRAPEVLL